MQNPTSETKLKQTFDRLGFDIDKPEDMRKLREALEWITEQREIRDKRGAALSTAGWSALVVLLGALATTIGDWLIRKGTGGH